MFFVAPELPIHSPNPLDQSERPRTARYESLLFSVCPYSRGPKRSMRAVRAHVHGVAGLSCSGPGLVVGGRIPLPYLSYFEGQTRGKGGRTPAARSRSYRSCRRC